MTAIRSVEVAAAMALGGIGKPQLVCEFVRCYGQFFARGVFWLRFADPAVAHAELAAFAGADGMQFRSEFCTLPLDEQVKLVLAAWERPSARLLVFDNREDEALLEQGRLKHVACQVLRMSRGHHWDTAFFVQAWHLAVLTRTDSLVLPPPFALIFPLTLLPSQSAWRPHKLGGVLRTLWKHDTAQARQTLATLAIAHPTAHSDAYDV